MAPPPIPTHVITGSLGVGKTTAIARLFAAKPESERWVVILNEFTESGIDVLTVAGQARGEFDVRLVPDGCLCCASELDFTRTLRDLVRGQRPARLFVEPSGIGHPAAIVETLLAHESHGAVRLESIVCLVDPAGVAVVAGAPGIARDQAEVADVLVLSKADLADDAQRDAFAALAASFYPPKRWIGAAAHGVLPPEALAPPAPRPTFAILPTAPAEHATLRDAPDCDARVALPALAAERRARRRVGRDVAAWVFERRTGFSRPALVAALATEAAALGAERVKGVFRTGQEHWALVQLAAGRVDVQESTWRRDGRVEVLLAPGAPVDWPAWDALWARAVAGSGT
jgi:G3E family GTPase